MELHQSHSIPVKLIRPLKINKLIKTRSYLRTIPRRNLVTNLINPSYKCNSKQLLIRVVWILRISSSRRVTTARLVRLKLAPLLVCQYIIPVRDSLVGIKR